MIELKKHLVFTINYIYISICLRLDVSSLKEIQWLQIELNEKGTIPMKVWCLECFICTNTSDEQSELDWL